MKKVLFPILVLPILLILMFIVVDQYSKYALKTATIKLVKEHCNKDIEVRDVSIKRISFNWLNGRYPKWIVETEPSDYKLTGYIEKGTYIPNRSGICYVGIKTPLKLDRLKREFVTK